MTYQPNTTPEPLAQGEALAPPASPCDTVGWALFWLDSALRCEGFHWDGDQYDAAAGALKAAIDARGQENPWKSAIDEALIVSCLDCIGPDDEPEATLARLIGWEVSVALDPAVSKSAADLVERGKSLAASAQLTDAQVMALWRECSIPTDENDHTTGPLPFARALLKLTPSEATVQAFDTVRAQAFREAAEAIKDTQTRAEAQAIILALR